MINGRRTGLAVCLALAGQFAAAFGVPVACDRRAASGHAPDAACGCCPVDRSAGRCCCSRPAMVDDVPACCAGRTKAAKHDAARDDSKLRWADPVVRQQCHGPFDSIAGIQLPPGVPPAIPTEWPYDRPDRGTVLCPSANLVHISIPPDEPSPRHS